MRSLESALSACMAWHVALSVRQSFWNASRAYLACKPLQFCQCRRHNITKPGILMIPLALRGSWNGLGHYRLVMTIPAVGSRIRSHAICSSSFHPGRGCVGRGLAASMFHKTYPRPDLALPTMVGRPLALTAFPASRKQCACSHSAKPCKSCVSALTILGLEAACCLAPLPLSRCSPCGLVTHTSAPRCVLHVLCNDTLPTACLGTGARARGQGFNTIPAFGYEQPNLSCLDSASSVSSARRSTYDLATEIPRLICQESR